MSYRGKRVGDTIWIQSQTGKIRECVIKELNMDSNAIKIHYISFSTHWDEYLSLDNDRIHWNGRPHRKLKVDDNISYYAYRQGYKAWIEAEVDQIKKVTKDKEHIRLRLVTAYTGLKNETIYTEWMPKNDPCISIDHKRSSDDPPPHFQYINAKKDNNWTILEDESMKYISVPKQASVQVNIPKMEYQPDDAEEKDLEELSPSQSPTEPVAKPLPPRNVSMKVVTPPVVHMEHNSVGTESDTLVSSPDTVDIIVDDRKEPSKEKTDPPEPPRKLNKFEKRMRKQAKKGVKDLREQAFLAMAVNRYLEFEGLYEFLEGMMKSLGREPPSKDVVREFFAEMHPNTYGQVTFTQFQKVVDLDGDVVAAYDRFRNGRGRNLQKSKTPRKRSKSPRKRSKSPRPKT